MAYYSPAQIDSLAQQLMRGIQGLSYTAAKTWITAESGDNNNVLGVTHPTSTGSVLNTYATPQQGIAAAINLFNTASWYRDAKAAIMTTPNATAQLRAIAATAWNPNHYVGNDAFKPYLGGQASTSTSAAAPAATPPATSTSTSSSGQTLADYLGRPAGELLTQATIQSFVARASRETGERQDDLTSYYADWLGHQLGQIPAPGSSFNSSFFAGAARSPSPADVGADLFGQYFGWVPNVIVGGAVLVIVVGLGIAGARRLMP